MSKQIKILKALWGTKLWNWLSNATLVGSIAENPSVMTASGWRVDRNGKAKQDLLNTKEVKLLRNNLTTIGEAGVTAPTIVGDIEGLYSIITYPRQTLNFILLGLSKIPLFSLEMKVSDILNNNLYMTKNIEKGAKEGLKDSKEYYSSNEFIEHLRATGLSEKEAKELQKLKLDNLSNTSIKYDNITPNAFGNNTVHSDNTNISHINPKMANTEDLARETVWHESGGHASSKGFRANLKNLISPREYHNIYANPWYRRLSEHNTQLIPELKPVWKAFIKGDIKTFNKLATKEDLEYVKNVKNPERFINYINDEQEVAARAISANIGDYVGKKSQWNLPQLEQFFTPEGIKKLRDNVWSVGTGLGGVLFINEDWAIPLKKKGGKLISRNPIMRFKLRYF